MNLGQKDRESPFRIRVSLDHSEGEVGQVLLNVSFDAFPFRNRSVVHELERSLS